jgi:hypothetical protein
MSVMTKGCNLEVTFHAKPLSGRPLRGRPVRPPSWLRQSPSGFAESKFLPSTTFVLAAAYACAPKNEI